MSEDLCVCCGAVVPEGTHVCSKCMEEGYRRPPRRRRRVASAETEYVMAVPNTDGVADPAFVHGRIIGRLIRCKNCIHYDDNGTCMKLGIAMLIGDWFCADGEEK